MLSSSVFPAARRVHLSSFRPTIADRHNAPIAACATFCPAWFMEGDHGHDAARPLRASAGRVRPTARGGAGAGWSVPGCACDRRGARRHGRGRQRHDKKKKRRKRKRRKRKKRNKCNPDCTGKTCGPNGCGGSCGACAGTEACLAGACANICDVCATGCTFDNVSLAVAQARPGATIILLPGDLYRAGRSRRERRGDARRRRRGSIGDRSRPGWARPYILRPGWKHRHGAEPDDHWSGRRELRRGSQLGHAHAGGSPRRGQHWRHQPAVASATRSAAS